MKFKEINESILGKDNIDSSNKELDYYNRMAKYSDDFIKEAIRLGYKGDTHKSGSYISRESKKYFGNKTPFETAVKLFMKLKG
jgi:hypothetical protein